MLSCIVSSVIIDLCFFQFIVNISSSFFFIVINYFLFLFLSNIITCIIVLCIHVFLMLLKPMIVLITGHCLENYLTDQFIFLLLECLCIGTQGKNYVLGGELKCRHNLQFLMEYDKEEYCFHRYLLYIWMISLY